MTDSGFHIVGVTVSCLLSFTGFTVDGRHEHRVPPSWNPCWIVYPSFLRLVVQANGEAQPRECSHDRRSDTAGCCEEAVDGQSLGCVCVHRLSAPDHLTITSGRGQSGVVVAVLSWHALLL